MCLGIYLGLTQVSKSQGFLGGSLTEVSIRDLHSRLTEGCEPCPTLCDPIECSPPDSSVPGIFQARILEGFAISSSRGSSWSRHWTHVSCTAGGFFTAEASGHCLTEEKTQKKFPMTKVIGKVCDKSRVSGTFLVDQWLSFGLPMQGTQVQSVAWELGSHMPQGNSAHVPQSLSPWATANEAHVPYHPCSTTREATAVRSP